MAILRDKLVSSPDEYSMNTLRLLAATAVLLWSASFAAADTDADAVGIAEKVALQATMQRHINSRLIDDAYLHLNRTTGRVRKLYPVSVHPVILQIGRYFVLCADFRDRNGKNANIDFYLARRNGGYIVFQSVVDDRRRLELFRKTNS
ncbi:MAG: hypothetical protein ACI9JL_001859 [Paracoccaceae bacterium]